MLIGTLSHDIFYVHCKFCAGVDQVYNNLSGSYLQNPKNNPNLLL